MCSRALTPLTKQCPIIVVNTNTHQVQQLRWHPVISPHCSIPHPVNYKLSIKYNIHTEHGDHVMIFLIQNMDTETEMTGDRKVPKTPKITSFTTKSSHQSTSLKRSSSAISPLKQDLTSKKPNLTGNMASSDQQAPQVSFQQLIEPIMLEFKSLKTVWQCRKGKSGVIKNSHYQPKRRNC